MISLYKQIKTVLHTGYMRTTYILGIPFMISETTINTDGSRKKKRSLTLFRKMKSYHDNSKTKYKPMFYLKINRTEAFVYRCIQHWVDIVNELNADFVFVCDKEELKYKVLGKIVFKNSNIRFIKSYKKPLNSIVKNIATPIWKNATYAQLTTFMHAKKNNIESFFNIDADDTMFVCPVSDVCKILKTSQIYADNNDINAFSLDMHVTQFRNKHWSFGITYINNNFNWIQIFKANKNMDWQKDYLKYGDQFNLDWFMTYLRTKYKNKIETYNIENLMFIHWTTLSSLHIGYALQRYSNNYMYYPIFKYFCDDDELYKVKTPKDVKIFDIGINDKTAKYTGIESVIHEKFCKSVVNMWENV